MTDTDTMVIPANIDDWHAVRLEKGYILVQRVPANAMTAGGIILPDVAKRAVDFFLVLKTHPDDEDVKEIRGGDWIYLDGPHVIPIELLKKNEMLDGRSDIGWTFNTGHAALIPGPRDGSPVEAMEFSKKDDDNA